MKLTKPELVKDAKRCWRWLSMQIPALNLMFLATWSALPDKFQDAIPLPWLIGAAVVLIVAGMFGRLVAQKEASHDDAAEQ